VRRLFAALLLALAVLAGAPDPALAQRAEPQVSVEVSSRRVEVGEPFTVRLQVNVERNEPTPSDPQLRGVPRELHVSTPSIGTQTSVQIINGQVTAKVGVSVTWELTGDKPGHYMIPSPSVAWSGGRLQGRSITIDVVPSTGRPRQPQGGGSLLPGGPMTGWPFGGRRSLPSLLDALEDSESMDAAELAMDRAPDAQVFLRAVADKQAAVVGEQVTISFYCYRRVEVRPVADRKPALADFLRIPLVQDPNTAETRAMAGGKRYLVSLVDRVALFPLRAGELHTGALTWVFDGGRERASNDVVVRVAEPPLAGRPPGYSLGDVGRFALTASVQPRRTEQGGALSVTLKIAGTGNPPQALEVPARTGVEWLDPEKRESIEPRGSVVQGYRSFGYVVRIGDSGTVDLGKVELPFWDPTAKRYQVASVALGTVEVTPVAPPAGASGTPAAADAKTDAFASLPPARRTLGAFAPARRPLLDGPRFWWLLALPPMAVALYTAGARGLGSLRERRAAGATSAATLTEKALDDAAKAEAAGDAKALAAAVERALHHAIEGATGLRARGVLRDELGRELDGRGVPSDLAARLADALGACESVRFDPTATAASLGELAQTTRALTRDLARLDLAAPRAGAN
jgi:hypothetical protein